MKAEKHAIRVNGGGLGLSDAEFAELIRLQRQFKRHHISYVVTIERATRFLAYGSELGVRPHTIITDDLTELRIALEQAASS